MPMYALQLLNGRVNLKTVILPQPANHSLAVMEYHAFRYDSFAADPADVFRPNKLESLRIPHSSPSLGRFQPHSVKLSSMPSPVTIYASHSRRHLFL